ncbi:unnamed protein product [Urochloa decumbens]|uniref:Uncharacterized protein n=1 Tax=Urochloa decumbens TaxID=240449 RepID=A0ABC9AHF2_9POAL
MAELVASMVVGPLLSLVKEKASSYLLDQYKVMEGMEEQHKILKRKLPAILDVIADAEEKATHREGVKAWLEEVKTVAYVANEAFDEFNYEALRREAKEKGHMRKLGFNAVKLFPTHNRVAFRNKMGNKLRSIVQTIEVLVAEMNAFGFNYQHQAPASKQWRETDSIIVDSENIASESRAEEKQKLVKRLIDRANVAELTVLAIFGMGGMGKTTLAQLIYHDPDVQKHFELRKWVCVSDDFDVFKIANKICNSSEKNLEEAQKKLQEELKGKRYLIVLDDVWNEDAHKWEKLKASLQHDANGCVVLTTTRKEGVAELMGTVQAHDIARLDDKFIKQIIVAKALTQERKPGLVALVDSVVQRCAGSPLAANALGSVLHGKTSSEEWNAVLSKSIAHNKEDQILPILKLSYDDLPPHMKQCFAFCAVFPKGHEIDVEMLIQLWMANGFTPEEKDVHLETTGKQIFNELLSRSFFQDLKQDKEERDEEVCWYCSTTTCKIHDLMHDVALSIMGKEVATITEKPKQSEFLQNTCRHLFLSCDEPEEVLNDSLKIRSPTIQTQLCGMRIESSLQHLAKYSSLRALELYQGKSTFLLKPKQLHHLRYLDISCSDIKALPEDISILYNLHTLNVSKCEKLGRLPKGIKYMTALRHLYTHGCEMLKCMPPELGQLTSLQTLTNFVVGTGSDCSSIGELQHLNNLRGPLLLSQLENVTEAADAKQANIGNKKELRELSLTWTSSETEKQHCHKVLEGLEAPHGLEALRIKYYHGTSFPTWMGMLPKMVELHLYGCNNSNKLPPLASARALQVLRLERLEKLECLCSGGTFFDLFPNLKELTLDELPEFDRWCEINWVQGEQILFPQLEKLFIVNCGKLTALPGAALLRGSCGGDYKEPDEMKLWSAFPVLKVLELQCLAKFQRWGAAEATQGQQIIFPQLERLSICKCEELATLPEGPELGAALKVLKSEDLELGTTLCGGDYGKARSAFPALKVLELRDLTSFQRWGAPEAAQGQEIVFPRLENLSIWKCQKLIALPEGPLLGELRGGDYEKQARSAFPALKVLELSGLRNFQSWEEVEASQRGDTMFPHLEDLSIESCRNLAALPAGTPLAVSCGHSDVTARSALPRVMKLRLQSLKCFKSWGVTEAITDEHWTFPDLETLDISRCPELTTLPEAPKLSVLYIREGNPQISVSIRRVIYSLSKLVCKLETVLSPEHGAFELVDGSNKSPLTELEFSSCNFLFHSSALALWTCFVQLRDLEISSCHALVCWPEKEFQSLVSLRHLRIWRCNALSGYAKAAPGEPISQRNQLLPKLESLVIRHCASLVEVFNVPASLETMDVCECPKLESIFGEQQDEPELNQGPSADGVASTAVAKLSSSTRDHFLPCLESLRIYGCDSLSEVLNLPPSLNEINIFGCGKLQFLSGQLDALQKLDIWSCPELRSLESCLVEFSTLERLSLCDCKSLVVSLPDGPQAYSSLRYLTVTSCPGIKSLPSSLKKRLDSHDDIYKRLDARYKGAKLLKPKTWKYAVNL